jgi:ferredoxin-NADP reductase/MOSC domain-containing protein YiiM
MGQLVWHLNQSTTINLTGEPEASVSQLLSVNVGLPRDVEWQGKTVHTGIWKEPVEGRRMVRSLNIDGDGQGDLVGHGGEHRAVFVYQIESYRYWGEQLGRDDFTYGQFGENFTIEGLPDDEVCIGDQYRIGEAVFEVTQPRVTCYRVGIRMDEPQMPSLLVAHRRPGFYFRVLQEGEVQAGDTISTVATGPGAMTVAEIDGLLYLPRHPRHSLARAVRIPALSEGWRGSFQSLLDQSPDSTGNQALNPVAGQPLAWAGFRSFRVTGIGRESASVMSIHLAPLRGGLSPARPGQFLTVRLRPDPEATPLLRSYSLSGLPDSESYRISVKREEHGTASRYLHGGLRVGDTLEAGAPRGTFVLRPGDRPVVLASAGVGATPVLAMLHTLAAEHSVRQVWWLHGARNGAEHSFAEEVEGLLARLADARRVVCYSSPGSDDRVGEDFDVAGRLTAQVLDDVEVPTEGDFYLCGPGPFLHDLGAALAERGVTLHRIYTEIFGPSDSITPGVVDSPKRAPHLPEGSPGTGPVISFSRSNLSVPWDPTFLSLLELAEACDVPVRWSCRTGVCHTCESGLVSGALSYQPDPIEEPAAGNALICCSQPQTDLVLDL